MNTPVRRIAIAVMAMVLVLLANLTYVQVIKASDYRKDPRNLRVLLAEYARERGQITTAGGQVVANSVPTGGPLRFQRQYPLGKAYGPVTGYYSVRYGATGVERSMDEVLNGSDGRLFVRRLSDLITGRDPRGGGVVLTIDRALQQVAYDSMTKAGYTGSVVAIKPDTGEILAMVSTPSFDPGPLANHSGSAQQQAWAAINQTKPPELPNRAVAETYPPGSTFKLVDVAAALQNGYSPDSQLTAKSQIVLTGTTNATLDNFGGNPCGPAATASLREAVARSCNTAFAELAAALGEDKLREQAERFGIGETDVEVPMPVAASSLGEIRDVAALQQSGIGQRDVRLTPLQNAMIAATIANKGRRMAPHLVKEIQSADLTTVDLTEPVELGEAAMSPSVAATVVDLMRGSEARSGGGGKDPSLAIASKTGTAEHGANPKTTPPHNWYVALAPAENPQIAICVLVENGGDRGLDGTGGTIAGPIGRAVIAAALRGARR